MVLTNQVRESRQLCSVLHDHQLKCLFRGKCLLPCLPGSHDQISVLPLSFVKTLVYSAGGVTVKAEKLLIRNLEI